MRSTLAIILLITVGLGCKSAPVDIPPKKIRAFEEFRAEPNTLTAIQQRSRLRAITYFHSMSYFIANGSQAGFEFGLAEEFANWLGVDLEIVIPPSSAAMQEWLNDGGGDLIITPFPLSRTPPGQTMVSAPYGRDANVIVVRKAFPNMDSLPAWQERPLHLIRKSNQHHSILAIAKRDKLTFALKLLPEDHADDELLELLAAGDIEAALLEERFAKVAIQSRYPDLSIALRIDESAPIGWLLPEGSVALKERLDQFFAIHYRLGEDGVPKGSAFYNILWRNFFETPPLSRWHFPDPAVKGAPQLATVSNYDPMVRLVAQELGLDWRLLLAVMYEESKFDPTALSRAGAKGLMQLMPQTFESLGFKKIYDTEENIRAGATYLKSLFKRFERENLPDDEKIRFVLASYNAGAGHLDDARQLARKQGWLGDRWHGGIKQAFRLLTDERYYSQVTHGYCRGGETIDYVERITERYSLFKKFLAI